MWHSESSISDSTFLSLQFVVESRANQEGYCGVFLILPAANPACNVHIFGTFASLILILYAEQYFTENFWTNSSLASTFANKQPCYFNSGVSFLSIYLLHPWNISTKLLRLLTHLFLWKSPTSMRTISRYLSMLLCDMWSYTQMMVLYVWLYTAYSPCLKSSFTSCRWC